VKAAPGRLPGGHEIEGSTMIKDVLVNLGVRASRDVAAEYALSLAGIYEAHVGGVAFAFEPVIPGTLMGGVPAEAIEASRAESRKAADEAITRFEKAAQLAGVSFESRKLESTLVGAADLFGQLARRSDLAVVAQAEPNRSAGEEMIIEAALFQSGRPLIVVPYIQKGGHTLERVLVGWDGSRTAARAIGDAIPLLGRATAVELVTVATERAKRDEITGAAMGHHLARHGIKVEVKRLVAGDTDVANTILSHAADVGADFIVMGGYGHSRLREFILGGATRGILESMTVPVLMSH
jgi:nucleotide-binding universal stress UspA family protein